MLCNRYTGIILDDNDEIATAEDLYDVVGSMLEGLNGEMDLKTVQQICTQLYNTRNWYLSGTTTLCMHGKFPTLIL